MKTKNKIYFLESKSIYIRPFELKDITKSYLRWINNPDINFGIEGRYPLNEYEAKEFFDSTKKSKTSVMFAICLKTNSRHIGNCMISNIDWINSRCRFGRIIGEKKYRSKGIGSEITYLLQKYVFEKLNLNSMFTGTKKNNLASIRSNKKSGMQIEGISKEAIYSDGKYYDEIRFGITKKMYFAKFKIS